MKRNAVPPAQTVAAVGWPSKELQVDGVTGVGADPDPYPVEPDAFNSDEFDTDGGEL